MENESSPRRRTSSRPRAGQRPIGLQVYSNLDDHGNVVRVPKGWELGREFDVRFDGIWIEARRLCDLTDVVPASIAHKPARLDAGNGLEIFAWFELTVSCDQDTLSLLLDEEVEKFFELSLTDLRRPRDALDRELYLCLYRPAIVVQRKHKGNRG